MSVTENEAIARRIVEEVWSAGNLQAVDDLYASTYVEHNAPPGTPPGTGSLKQLVSMYREAFPELRCSLDGVVASDDQVAFRWTAAATHRGAFLGIPATGTRGSVSGITIAHVRDGKVQEDWTIMDQLGLLTKLGARIGLEDVPHDQAVQPHATTVGG